MLLAVILDIRADAYLWRFVVYLSEGSAIHRPFLVIAGDSFASGARAAMAGAKTDAINHNHILCAVL